MTQLETERLILRPTTADDWPQVREFLMCEDTMRHLGGHQQEPDAWRTLAQWIGVWSLTKAAMFGVIERSSGEWIGRIGPLASAPLANAGSGLGPQEGLLGSGLRV